MSVAALPLAAPPAHTGNNVGHRWLLLPVAACLIFAVMTGALVWTLARGPASDPQQVSRTVIPLPANSQLAPALPSLAISPDGRLLAYIA